MALDPQVKAILDQMAQQDGPPIYEMTPADARQMYLDIRGLLSPQDLPIGKSEDITIPGKGGDIRARTYTPVAGGGQALPVLVFYHGGGFVIGDLDTHDPVCRLIAEEAGCKVVSVDYRLAPENPFPAAVDDAFAAVKWVEANARALGVDPNRIAVGGDSAGGNLAAVVSQMARDARSPHIAFQLLIYPVTDARAKTGSRQDFAEGYFLEQKGMDWFMDAYIPKDADPADPRISPLKAKDFSGLPPAYVITAGFDPLRDEGRAYADKLRAAGVDTKYIDYSGLIHGFFNMTAVVEEAHKGVLAAASALREALS